MRRSFLLFALILLALLPSCGRKADDFLIVYCGGTMRPPIEELAKDFEGLAGVPVRVTSGDSGTLLTQIRETRRGDLYVCHDPFAAMAENDRLVSTVVPVAQLVPVIAVPTGNPGKINGLSDLARPGLKLALPDPVYSTAGNVLTPMLAGAGLTDKVKANTSLTQRSSSDLANALVLGSVDAVVCWDAVARQHPRELDIVPIDARYFVDAVTSATGKKYNTAVIKVTVCSLPFSTHPDAVAKFLQFVASDRGRQAFARHGFTLINKEP